MEKLRSGAGGCQLPAPRAGQMARSMSLMQAHTRPVTRRLLLGFVVAGFAVGLVVGHLFMGGFWVA